MNALWRYLRRTFELDLRSLALFRVGLGLFVVGDVIERLREVPQHYTDLGILPRDVLISEFIELGQWSFHLATGSATGQYLLFLLHGLIGLALILGWQTRLMTILAWMFTLSLHHRNGMILYGGDTVLRIMLFWSLFLPLGARFSVDEALDPEPLKETSTLSMGSASYVLQICSVYLFTAVLKWHPVWIGSGTAVYYALQLDIFATDFGRWLLNFPEAMKWASHGTIVGELSAPLLLLMPWRRNGCRLLAVTGAVFFHMVILTSTMMLAAFPIACTLLWIPVLPASVWSWLYARWATDQRRGWVIYYDGGCGFCKKVVHILRSFLWLRSTPLVPAQDVPEMAALMERENSWVVLDHLGQTHLRFSALAVAVGYSPMWGWLATGMKLSWVARIGEQAYQWVASHRLGMGRWTRHLHWRARDLRPSTAGSVLATIGLIAMLLWNLRTTDFSRYRDVLPRRYNYIVYSMGLEQYWNLFAPFPMKDDGWYIVEGTLRDKSTIDLFRGGAPVTWDPPAKRRAEYTSHRQFKYLLNIWKKKHKKHRLHYGRYLCRKWAKELPYPRRLETLKIYFMRERTTPPGGTAKVKKSRIWRHYCYTKPEGWESQTKDP